MKKSIQIVVILLIALQTAKAQDGKKQEFKRFGVFVGGNYTNMRFSTLFTTPQTSGKIKPKPGVIVGVALHIPIVENLSLQTEYAFSTRNAEVETSQRNYSLTYLFMPVLLKYKIANHLSIMAGPEADLLIYSKRKTNGVTEDLEHQTEDRSVDAVVGLEYKIAKSFYVSARYLRGLTHVGIESNSTEFMYEIGQLTVGIEL